MSLSVQTISNHSYRGHNHDEGDGTPYSSFDHEVCSYDGCRVFYTEGETRGDLGWRTKRVDSDAKPGDVVFVVIAVFSTGGTFGRTEGNTSVIGVFDDAKRALEIKRFIEKDYEDYQSGVGGRYDFTIEHEGFGIYAEWKGYFESLDGVYVETEVVRA